MRFTELSAALLLASFAVAHSGGHIPKIVASGSRDVGKLKNRNLLDVRAAKVAGPEHALSRRQGGVADGRCGADHSNASCAEGYCCSIAGYCGKGPDYCSAPDCRFQYGPACDTNLVPTGGSTRNTPRTKLGNQKYGGEGIYDCVTPNTIAITYDDGPYIYTNDVLDQLKAYNAKATFFVTGININKGAIDDKSKAWPAIISRMIAEGHQVASHTWSHQDLSVITKEQRYDQLVRNEMALANIIGKFPTYMRPPYSSCTAASGCQNDLADLGYVVSYFDLDTDDYNNVTPELIQNAKNRVDAAINPSDPSQDAFLSIAHDIHQQTAKNLTGHMLDVMTKKGYKLVTLGECMGEPEANWYRTPTDRPASSSVFTPPVASPTSSGAASAVYSTVVATPTAVSPDGSCGAKAGYTCLGFTRGECCSQYGFCGNTDIYCGTGCDPKFGKCGGSGLASGSSSSELVSNTASALPTASPINNVSKDGSCGGADGYTCAGYFEGECCSQYGWCGSGAEYCGVGCNPLLGRCSSSEYVSISPVPVPAASSTRTMTTSTRTTAASTRTSSAPAATSAPPNKSPDGRCGESTGYTCKNSGFGSCCSGSGRCTNDLTSCITLFGCQKAFGSCL